MKAYIATIHIVVDARNCADAFKHVEDFMSNSTRPIVGWSLTTKGNRDMRFAADLLIPIAADVTADCVSSLFTRASINRAVLIARRNACAKGQGASS